MYTCRPLIYQYGFSVVQVLTTTEAWHRKRTTFVHQTHRIPLNVTYTFIFVSNKNIDSQARSSLYANTQLRAHRRAEKNKEQKKKIKKKKRNNKFPDPLFQVWLLALQKRLATPLNYLILLVRTTRFLKNKSFTRYTQSQKLGNLLKSLRESKPMDLNRTAKINKYLICLRVLIIVTLFSNCQFH